SNETASGQVISYKPNRDFITASIEGGKRYEYKLNPSEKYIVEPKAEFQYAHSKAKSFTASNNSSIHYGKTDSKALRVGSMLGYEKHLDNGSVLEPFVEINGIQEFGGKTNISYAGGNTKSDISGFSVEVGGGLNAKIDDNWNFYSDVMYEKGSVVEAISTNIGLRYNW
ncbi:MAG: autotransporter outer membrane beta-barrel domain-containing protein, partial [Alphaproteobacteria bacterium]